MTMLTFIVLVLIRNCVECIKKTNYILQHLQNNYLGRYKNVLVEAPKNKILFNET